MTKNQRFTFRIDAMERHLLGKLAQRLKRNKSDTIRLVLNEAFRTLLVEEDGEQTGPTEA
jgi:hypothetical protein